MSASAAQTPDVALVHQHTHARLREVDRRIQDHVSTAEISDLILQHVDERRNVPRVATERFVTRLTPATKSKRFSNSSILSCFEPLRVIDAKKKQRLEDLHTAVVEHCVGVRVLFLRNFAGDCRGPQIRHLRSKTKLGLTCVCVRHRRPKCNTYKKKTSP